VAGQVASFLEGAAGFDEGHEPTLVVLDTGPDNPLASFGLDDARLEGRTLPQIERIRRLHIVMTVKEQMRHVRARRLGMADNYRARP
jgi:hypothetical protein